MNNNFEILAPAGDMDNLQAAVFAGANSVYLGVQSFNARASASNFDYQQLKQAVAFCHARNVKVNVTLNTILYDNEIADFVQTVEQVAACGVDAVILQDLAAARIAKQVAPDLPRHGSTQMAVHSLEGALLLKEMGFSRVILAREASLDRVKEITQNCGIETEVFVHGALCVCLSGQCYASAFLGGRSGNRGRCAGTCRLPLSARGDLEDNHLSLKDLCAVDMVGALKEIGVSCVKIEGRLRTPEYVAGAVDACLKALHQQEFDKQILADTFSRSGFTNAFLENTPDKNVFGVRTKEDSKKTKEILPSLRQLYRREGQYVPVDFQFVMGEQQSVLTISDGQYTFSEEIQELVQDTENDYLKSLSNSLGKLGGTPFYLRDLKVQLLENKYLPLAAVNQSRKNLTQQLLQARSTLNVYAIEKYAPTFAAAGKKVPQRILRVQDAAQIPYPYEKEFEFIIVPIENASQISESIKEKLVWELPRDLFGDLTFLKKQIQDLKSQGYNRFCIQNIGHIPLVKDSIIFTSFTLNISNSLSAQEYAQLGVSYLTLSPEITVNHIAKIDTPAKTIVYAYGHVPLMLTKSCPMQNVRSCAECNGEGHLTDRKGMKMPVRCHGKIAGYREIFNPIPVYMGDRLHEISSDYVSLNFTIETPNQVASIVEKFLQGQAFDGSFTRGLYYKGSI